MLTYKINPKFDDSFHLPNLTIRIATSNSVLSIPIDIVIAVKTGIDAENINEWIRLASNRITCRTNIKKTKVLKVSKEKELIVRINIGGKLNK